MISECTDKRLGALIHAYELDALSEDDAQRFEIHLMECEHCFREVDSFKSQAEVLCADEGIRAAARERSRWSFGQGLGNRMASGGGRPVTRVLAVIAIFLIIIIPVYLGLIHPVLSGDGKMQSILFNDHRLGVDPLSISEGDKASIDIIFEDFAPDKTYLIEMIHLDDSLIAESWPFDQFDAGGRGSLIISLDDKKPGLYILILRDPNVKPAVPLREYPFRIIP